jgi:cytochrome c oxidase subunit 3
MTGLHAIHMIVGLILVGAFIWLGSKGRFTNGNDQPVEIAGLYWHFVDIIWVFLFPLLYLIAGFHPGGR